ncbi:MAG: hypothetical protein IKH77_01025 [Clostridia bacterium]|nr:hypothetical protein [Clostridia bacterium]
MKDLEKLRVVAEEGLAGLTAGTELRGRILAAASEQNRKTAPTRPLWVRWTAVAAACTLVLAVALGVVLGGNQAAKPVLPGMTVMTAGDDPVANERASLDRGSSGLNVVSKNAGTPQGIWESSQSGAFPMVVLGDRVYRRLTAGNLAEDALGAPIATIWEQADEPDLSDGNVSNVMPKGTEVYGVKGMDGTLVACRTENGIAAFQRVSYNGTAISAGERFTDVMQLDGHVVAMSLSGVGMVEGERAEQLFGILAENAQYESAGSISGSQVLLIELDNGAAVQMTVRNDRLAACGVWVCPEFFEAFGN